MFYPFFIFHQFKLPQNSLVESSCPFVRPAVPTVRLGQVRTIIFSLISNSFVIFFFFLQSIYALKRYSQVAHLFGPADLFTFSFMRYTVFIAASWTSFPQTDLFGCTSSKLGLVSSRLSCAWLVPQNGPHKMASLTRYVMRLFIGMPDSFHQLHGTTKLSWNLLDSQVHAQS